MLATMRQRRSIIRIPCSAVPFARKFTLAQRSLPGLLWLLIARFPGLDSFYIPSIPSSCEFVPTRTDSDQLWEYNGQRIMRALMDSKSNKEHIRTTVYRHCIITAIEIVGRCPPAPIPCHPSTPMVCTGPKSLHPFAFRWSI